MDGDPAVEHKLDSFSLAFPLPYRVAFIIIMAVWGWGVNLHFLYRRRIDVPTLIRYPGRSSPSQLTHHHSTYRLASFLSLTSGASLLVFWLFTRRDPRRVIDYDWLPMANLLILAVLFSIPLRRLSVSHAGRGRLLRTLRRVSVGGLAEAKDGKFGDILLADVLTSYAKVLADLFVCLCMFLFDGSGSGSGSATARPDRGCGGALLVPLIMALPSAIRLRQCLIEFVRVRRAPFREATGWGGQHLANAAKYSTAFPVIVLGAMLRGQKDGGAPGLFRAWVAACLLNSLYSFYWDVAKDWDLTLFSKDRDLPDHPFGLRRTLLVHRPGVYYAVIALDLVLRCTWMVKLSARMDHISDFESSIFLMQFLEVFRRWIWIFFRVETEWIRNSVTSLGHDDMVLLGDYQGNKYEDED
ncbi:EXS family-domain-containing protein [Corynascus novoguineensis]|uniref:EXS family-domain-containing protein n=1 Tax=Corynascus novoguineensis TaxID=1126955 RepID=A0AAN7CZG0_9PEZI|nr:EXS family-domain-containing protein [Corynascus novoguineensis]